MMLRPKLSLTLIAAAISATAASGAFAADFAMHGYMRSGIIMTDDGTRANDVGLMTGLGKFRLGNEQNTKIELVPTMSAKTDDGVKSTFRANLTHETKCTADWNCRDGDGHDLQVREVFAEIENLPFAPGAVFWAGKRYSSSNASNHQYDWEYIQYNGTGGGVDKVNIGFAKLDVGVYAFQTSGGLDSNGKPVDPTPKDTELKGYSDDYSANIWLKSIGGSKFDLQFVGHSMRGTAGDAWKPAAEHGYGFTGVYNFPGWFFVPGGYSKAVVQYGRGLAAGDSLGKNGWGWANLPDTNSTRFVLDGLFESGSLAVSTFAFYQQDKHFRGWSGDADGWDRKLYAIGARPHYQISKYFAMQAELGYEHYDESDNPATDPSELKNKGGLVKATIAPTITFGQGYWSRPQIRAFVTYAKWDKGVSDRMDGGYTRKDKDGSVNSSTVNFGVVGEVWF